MKPHAKLNFLHCTMKSQSDFVKCMLKVTDSPPCESAMSNLALGRKPLSAFQNKLNCRKQWQNITKARRSGGILAAVRECQIIAALKLVFTHESPTGVYFFLAEIMQFVARAHNLRISKMKEQSRKQFVHQNFPLVFYDCACTLLRFVHADHRRNRTKMSKLLCDVKYVIDRFHFKKGHTGCKMNGSRPLPAVWPGQNKFNDSAFEQSFAFLKKIAVAARRMTQPAGRRFPG